MACGSFFILVSLLAPLVIASAEGSDFAVNANPLTLCVNPGIDAQSVISISSMGGFSGTVNLGDSVNPPYNNGPTLSNIPSSVTLAKGQTVSFALTIFTTTSTPLYTYTVTVSGLSGIILHQTNVELVVSSGCSVGAVIVPTTLGSIGSNIGLGITIAGLIGVASAALIVYESRVRTRKRQ